MHSLYGNLLIFDNDDEAIRLREVLQKVFRPEDIACYFGEIEVVSSRLLSGLDDKASIVPYNLFKQLTTQICLTLFLGLDFSTAKEEATAITNLTIAHWHGKKTLKS